MMKRCLSLLLAVALIIAPVLPVTATAAESNIGGWVELLETCSVQSNGENWFQMNGTSTTIKFPINKEARFVKIDMLVWHQTVDYPSSVSVTQAGSSRSLTVTRIDNNLSRVYGAIPNAFYEELSITFNKPTTSNVIWELLSCKATPVAKTEYPASAQIYGMDDNTYVDCPGLYSYYNSNDGVASGRGQYAIVVSDWQKFDSITIVGSVSGFGLNSVRANIGSRGLPFEISYTSTNSNGSYEERFLEHETAYFTEEGYSEGVTHGEVIAWDMYDSKVLYNVTIDLSGVDRAQTTPLYLYFTGVVFFPQGYTVQVIGVTGTVNTADTSGSSWWQRIKTHFNSLFTDLGTKINTGFSNLNAWISSQTSALKTELVGIWQETEEGFANVGTWISSMTTTLQNRLVSIWQEIEDGFANVGTWISNMTTTLKNQLVGIWNEIEEGFTSVGNWFEQYFGVKDQDAIDDLGESSGSISQGASDIHNFEQSQQNVLDSGFTSIQSAVTFTNFAAALVFVQKYANMTINGISNYTIVFTLPLFLGLFFYLCSRIPGVTRWKSRPPRSKGGGSP